MNRDHISFQWFIDILKNLEEVFPDTEDPFLTLNLFMTGTLRFNDIQAIALKVIFCYEHESLNFFDVIQFPGSPRYSIQEEQARPAVWITLSH